MNITENIKSLISEHFNTRLTDIKEIGKGASGQVYCIHLSSAPYKIAVKLSKHYDLMKQEKEKLEIYGSSLNKHFFEIEKEINIQKKRKRRSKK